MSAPRVWRTAAVLGAVGVSLALGTSLAGTSFASGSPPSGQSMSGMADMTGMAGMPPSAGSAAAPPPGQKAVMPAMDSMEGMHGMDGMDGMSDMPPAAASVASPASDRLPVAHDMRSMPGMQAPAAASPTLPANDHVPPPAPQQSMPEMSTTQMTQTMQMDDQAKRGMLLVDRLERSRSNDGDYASAWEVEAWYGSDIDRLWFLSEGERSHEGVEDARAELLWGHAFSTSWDWLAGVRQDFGAGPSRQWLGVGVQGEAAYFFELQAGLYAGPQGRSAVRLEISRDLLLTQRLILTPRLEVNLYGKDDPQRQVRSGLSDADAGLRLRYEVSRRFAPYIGVDWQRHFADGDALPFSRRFPAHETSVLVGVKFWF
jgi:copper resistance protein B